MTEATFRAKAPGIMKKLMRDFPISVEDAAAILGNLGHESGGLSALQELKPTVKGSRGGYGWAQWTGPRRRAFEAWCKSSGLTPSSDEANYGYLLVELKGEQKAAITAVKKATGLKAKVEAFEKIFERAGVKHYPERLKWAQRALAAFAAPVVSKPAAKPKPAVRPAGVAEPSKSEAVLHKGSTGAFLRALTEIKAAELAMELAAYNHR